MGCGAAGVRGGRQLQEQQSWKKPQRACSLCSGAPRNPWVVPCALPPLAPPATSRWPQPPRIFCSPPPLHHRISAAHPPCTTTSLRPTTPAPPHPCGPPNLHQRIPAAHHPCTTVSVRPTTPAPPHLCRPPPLHQCISAAHPPCTARPPTHPPVMPPPAAAYALPPAPPPPVPLAAGLGRGPLAWMMARIKWPRDSAGGGSGRQQGGR